MTEDGKEYIGGYHTYTTGEVFTQASYVRDVSKKLIPYKDVSQQSVKEVFDYDDLPKDALVDFTDSINWDFEADNDGVGMTDEEYKQYQENKNK